MLYEWKKEFETWLQKPCIVLDGTAKQRSKKILNWTDGLVITYGTLRLVNRINKEGKETKTGELLNIIKRKPDCVIVDEIHRARNRQTLTARSLYKLSSVIPIKIALTGTPAYSKQTDIYSILHFLYPKNVKSFRPFIDEYFLTEQIWTPHGTVSNPTILSPEGTRKLNIVLNQIATQRKQSDPDVMPWLPEKPIPKIIKIPTNKMQENMFIHLKKYFETGNVITQGVIDRLMRYRQIANDPRLVDNTIKQKSPKTQWIERYLKEYADTPTIFFGTLSSYLKLLYTENCTNKIGIITGETPMEKRTEIVNAFQTGSLNCLFINTQTGQEGLTLDRTENMFIIDQYAPAGSLIQALERLTATSKAKKDIPKRIYKLIMEKTYEEDIEYAMVNNLSAIDIVNNFKKYN